MGDRPGGRRANVVSSDSAPEILERVREPGRLAAVRATGLLDTAAEEPFDRLARLAAKSLRAPFAFVTVVDEQRSFWKSCIGIEATDPAERQNPVHESFCQYVIGSGSELVVGDAAGDPRTCDNPSIALMGVAAWAGFPLRSPDGHVLGSFCVVDTTVRSWTAEDIEVLRSLADAAAGEIALRAAAEKASALARSLQQALLPPATARIPGVEVGAIYRAAGAGDEVMGDFYDIFESADGRWNVVLGDVCGKGIQAAKLTGLSRYTLRAGAMRQTRPSRVLAQLHEALRMDPVMRDGRFVTAVMLALDRHEHGVTVTLSSAGHVPALLRSRDGVDQVSPTGGALGLMPDVRLDDVELRLAPGDIIVLCTDGVTEARDPQGQQFGEQRLADTIAGAHGDAQAVARAVERAVTDHAGPINQDDIAIVALRIA